MFIYNNTYACFCSFFVLISCNDFNPEGVQSEVSSYAHSVPQGIVLVHPDKFPGHGVGFNLKTSKIGSFAKLEGHKCKAYFEGDVDPRPSLIADDAVSENKIQATWEVICFKDSSVVTFATSDKPSTIPKMHSSCHNYCKNNQLNGPFEAKFGEKIPSCNVKLVNLNKNNIACRVPDNY